MKTEHLTEVKQILKQHQFKKLFSGDTENTFIQFFRYCFVGGFATVVELQAANEASKDMPA